MSPVALQVNFQEVCCGLPVPDVTLMETLPFWVHSPPLLKPIPATSVSHSICKLLIPLLMAPPTNPITCARCCANGHISILRQVTSLAAENS
jgi:hypothetical protein